MDLINFLRVLFKRKWLILAITSVAAITTFLITREAPQVYKAQSQLATGIAGSSGVAFSGYSRGLQNYEIEARFKHMVEMVRSPQVLNLVSYRLMLHDLEKTEPFRNLNELRSQYSPEDLRVARARYQTKLDSLQPLYASDELERKHIQMLRKVRYDYEALRTTLQVQRIPGTDLLGVEFISESPYLSAFVVNTLSQEFIRYYARVKADRSKNSIEFFTQMLEEKKDELDDKVKAWESYQKAQGITAVSNPMQTLMEEIETLERQRELANEDLFTAERRLIKIQNSIGDEYMASLLENELSRGQSLSLLLRKRLTRLNERYVRSGFRATAQDSLRLATEELTDELFQNQVEGRPGLNENLRISLRQKIEQELRLDLSRERIQLINRELQRQGSSTATFTSQEGFSSPIGKEVEVARDAYLLVLNKLNEAKLTAMDFVAGEITQQSFVQPPEQAEPSKTVFLTVLSALVSLILCVVVLFLLEYLDVSIRYPSRFTEMTGLSLIGVLNRLTTKNLDLVSLFSEPQKNQSLESYKQLLRNIRHEITSTDAKSILVTSTRGGSGKTSLLVSLAYSMSLNGKKVLLIDTNFKQSSLTQITDATPTLERYLNKEISRKMLVSNSVFEGVDVIGCEGGEFSPLEVFSGDELQKMLESMENSYDIILMEGPELNQYADTKELSDYADRVLPVFSATTGVNAADRAPIDYLNGLDLQLMGAVLNKVEVAHLNR
ncbi:MAG: AAA family ATPase [Bacteroidota bacterium]